MAQRFSAASRLPERAAALAAEVLIAAPARGKTSYSTYFITASTFQKQNLFQSERFCLPFLDTLLQYRLKRKYLLHEFVIMPNHFHLLITPIFSLEKALQFIKGGFSYRANKGLGFAGEIWQPSYYDHRVRDVEEYFAFRRYILQNPVKRGLVTAPEEYPYSSAFAGFVLDEIPERLRLSA